MMIEAPYDFEWSLYHKTPIEDRWIFNKLILAERLGYDCGPVGTLPKGRGLWCVRPIMNVEGMGSGGFYKFDTRLPFQQDIRKDRVANANPGYFWCEWFNGLHTYTSYFDDVPRFNASAPGVENPTEGARWDMTEDSALNDATVLPSLLQGISKYLYVEAIGGKIIEVAPRHSPMSARQTIINEHRIIDSAYTPKSLEFGAYDMVMENDPAGGFHWVELPNSRRVFVSEN